MSKRDYKDWNKDDLIRELESFKKQKKYGLAWEDNPEEVAELCKEKLPVLEEDSKRAVSKKNQPINIIIEGDNYHALSVLNYTHPRSFDVIYIDPPYNTGARDWKYNNRFVDSSDTYRHSKWLSLINKRLLLAKKLLKKDGVLIIAIDDNECHRLRVLVDEIMPAHDTTSVTIVHNPRGNITNNFARTHEYALFIIPKGLKTIARTKKENTAPRKLRRWGHNSTRTARPTMFYPIYVKKGKVIRVGEAPTDKNFHPKSKNVKKRNGEIEIWPIDQNGVERRWNFGLDKVNDELNRIVPIEKDGVLDLFLTEEDTTPKTVWTSSEFEAGRNGATLVKSIIGKDFPFPKSIFTVKQCIELVTRNRPSAKILDFFAGSGTTGHAVLALNNEYEGNRTFVLCTNNEGKIAEDICYPRVKNVMKGYKDSLSGKKVAGLGGNLKYFQTAFVDATPTDSNKRALVNKSTEMLCLKEMCFEKVESSKYFNIFKDFDNKYLGIIYEDSGIETFKKEAKKLKANFNIYIFSLDESAREEEFEDMEYEVNIKPIPAVILNVYKRIFK